MRTGGWPLGGIRPDIVVPYIASTRSSSARFAWTRRAARRGLGSASLPVDVAKFRAEKTRLIFFIRVASARARERESPPHRACTTDVTLRASSRPLASRAVARPTLPPLPVSSLSEIRPDIPVYLPVRRPVSRRGFATPLERGRERRRELRARRIRDSERARCNGTSVTQSWEDYGIETPGGKAQCQSALHFVPVSTESVTRDVVFAAFPRKVSGGRAHDGGGGERKKLLATGDREEGLGHAGGGGAEGGERSRRNGRGTSLALGFAGHLLTFHGEGTAGAPSSAPRRNFARPRRPTLTSVAAHASL